MAMRINQRGAVAILPLILSQTVFAQIPPEALEAFKAAQMGQNQGLLVPKKPAPTTTPVGQPKQAQVNIPGFSNYKNLSPFGSSLFTGLDNPYVTASDMPVPADYVIGIGDMVEVKFFGKENKTYQLPVDRNGTITLPDIGPVSVVGMSFESMSKTVLEQISKQKIGANATVSMGPLRSIQVFLMGEVNNAGAYTTDALTTVVNALLIGGGIRPSGSMRRIEIRRQGKVVNQIDLYQALLKGAASANLRLQSGDTIFVPTVGKRVGVTGEVLRPGIYELLHENSVDDLLALAGNLLPTAHQAQVKLDRVLPQTGARQLVDLSLLSTTQRKQPLLNGDVIQIPSVAARWDRSVVLEGSVNTNAIQQWQQGIHLKQLISSFEQLAPDAYRPLAIIERTDPISGARTLRTINLLQVIEGKQLEYLQPLDRVIVLSQSDVEFLSSANVQLALQGKLPKASQKRVVLSNTDDSQLVLRSVAGGAKAESPDNDSLMLPKEALASKDKAANNELISKEKELDTQLCSSLIELADLVTREGGERFQGAILASRVVTGEAVVNKNMACPAIFEQTPALLPFALENSVLVRGEVKRPGVLPIPENLPLEVVVNAKGGMTREAEKQVEVAGVLVDSTGVARLERKYFSLNQLKQANITPGSQIMVRKRVTDMDSGSVRLSGEFLHPGTYQIRRGERLSDVITRAGGVTTNAYPLGAVFLRDRIKEEKKQFYEKAALELQSAALFAATRVRASSAVGVDAAAATMAKTLAEQMRSIDPVGRMVVEADPTVLQVRPELDVVLEPGDTIHVPRRPSSILVMGEVKNPGAVQFEAGKKASDYIDAVGGLSQLANADQIYAIFPNGNATPLKLSAWNFSPTLLPPGSTIYVSREALPTTSMDIMLIAVQVLKDVALTAASLSVISK